MACAVLAAAGSWTGRVHAQIPPAPEQTVDGAALAAALAAEINFARTQPAAYAQSLKAYRTEFHGKIVRRPGEARRIRTDEGVAAVDEAMVFLSHQTALPALEPNPVLEQSAGDHVREQGASGLVGHFSVDGANLGDRIDRYGEWIGTVAEDIGYGYTTGVEVARQLIVDDGVFDRGHRKAIFNPELRQFGVVCGPHKTYVMMCVIDFGSAVRPKASEPPREAGAEP